MEKDNGRPLDFTNSVGIRDPIYQAPLSSSGKNHECKNSQSETFASECHNGIDKQTSCKESNNKHGQPVHIDLVHSSTERQKSPRIQSKTVECFRGNNQIQNGRIAATTFNNESERLPNEVRPQRRVLLDSDSCQASEVSSIYVQQRDIRVSVPTIWSGDSAKNVYESIEASDCAVEETRPKSDYLPGRSVVAPSRPKGVDKSLQPSLPTIQRLGIYYKEGEMLDSTCPIPCFSRRTPEFSVHDNISAIDETAGTATGSTGIEGEESVHDPGTVFITGSNDTRGQDWNNDCTPALSQFAATTHQIGPHIWDLSPKAVCDTDIGSIGRPGMVDFYQANTGEQCTNNGTDEQHVHPNRCIPVRVGSSLSRSEDRGTLEQRRTTIAHQYPAVEGGVSGYSVIPEYRLATTREENPVTDGQHDGCSLYKQTRRDEIQRSNETGFRCLGIVPVEEHCSCGTAPARGSEYGGGCRVTADECQNRMDAGQTFVCENPETLLQAEGRSLRIQTKFSNSVVCRTSSRSWRHGDRCVHAGLESVDVFHTPANCIAQQNSGQTSPGPSNSLGDCTSVGRTTMVPNTVGDVSRLSCTTPEIEDNIISPVRQNGDSPVMENSSTDCVASFRGRMQTAGFSEKVCEVLLASWRDSTTKRYAGPWKTWACWCAERSKCPFSAPVNDILEFLTFQFKERNLAYRTIGVYKSCISQFHDLIDGKSVGSLPVVSRFMKGIFELQPPKPKIPTTWPVDKVIVFLQDLSSVEQLSLPDLSLKLAMLLALTSAARVHELIALNLANAIQKRDCWTFILGQHVKNSRPNHPGRKLSFQAYVDDPRICVVKCLQQYVQCTTELRGKEQQLLISYKAPHMAICSQTLSRWLRSVLTKAGIPAEYTGHSTRSASTSEAAKSGLPMELILAAADWSSATVFKKHYHKTTQGTFANSVLSRSEYS